MTELVSLSPPVGAIVFIGLGLLFCFKGRSFFALMLACAGFFVFFHFCGIILSRITENPTLLRFGPIVAGVAGALLSGFLFKAYLFFAGAVFGWFLLMTWLPEAALLFRILVALGMGMLLFLFSKPLIIVATALIGGRMTGLGITGVFFYFNCYLSVFVITGLSILMSIMGIIKQAGYKKKNRKTCQ